MNNLFRSLSGGMGLWALLMLAGCGSDYELAPVSGQVLCHEEPVPGGVVTFTPVTEGNEMPAPAAVGMIDANGKFVLATNGELGAMIGKHRVSVSLPEADDVEDLESDLKKLGSGGDDPEEVAELKAEIETAKKMAQIPCRQPDIQEVTVKAGENTIEIELVVSGAGEDD